MKVSRRKKRTANIGIFGVGFHKYWSQFNGLLDELTGKLNIFVDRVKAHEVQVTSFGIADDAESAYALLPKLRASNLDLVFCHMLTYATSASFGAIIRGLDIPLVLVALQP
jgi:L-arabinose isomerase